MRLVESLPPVKSSDVLGKQLLRSATSVGANYRAACRARSKADFISKIAVVEEEADESLYWLELLDESGLAKKDDLSPLLKEADELTAIFTAAAKTAKSKR
jgi:four helix bundle protein